MNQPHRCPICQGNGELPTNTTVAHKPCHACNGRGIVWEPEQHYTVVQPVYPGGTTAIPFPGIWVNT